VGGLFHLVDGLSLALMAATNKIPLDGAPSANAARLEPHRRTREMSASHQVPVPTGRRRQSGTLPTVQPELVDVGLADQVDSCRVPLSGGSGRADVVRVHHYQCCLGVGREVIQLRISGSAAGARGSGYGRGQL
jgi:hypothetical protein